MPTERRLVGSVVKLYAHIYVNGANANISTICLMRGGPVHTVGLAWALPALSIQMKWDGKPPFIPSNIQATAPGTASATPLSRQGTQSLCFSWQTHVCLTWSSHTLASWTARLRQRLFLIKPKIKPNLSREESNEHNQESFSGKVQWELDHFLSLSSVLCIKPKLDFCASPQN